MTSILDNIITGREIVPPRLFIYGQEKIGKTTFAAGADRPIVIQTEEGAHELGVPRFPLAKSLEDVAKAIKALATEEHDFGTVVLDSADWLEALIHASVCTDLGVNNISDVDYGKGYTAAAAKWRQVLDSLDGLRAKGMAVVIIGHAEVKRFDDPTTDGYDRFQPKLHKHAAALVTEWSDAIMFACLETFVKKEKGLSGAKEVKAKTSGRRVLRTTGAPAYVAGNRYGLPETIDLTWAAFEDAFAACGSKVEEKKAAE